MQTQNIVSFEPSPSPSPHHESKRKWIILPDITKDPQHQQQKEFPLAAKAPWSKWFRAETSSPPTNSVRIGMEAPTTSLCSGHVNHHRIIPTRSMRAKGHCSWNAPCVRLHRQVDGHPSHPPGRRVLRSPRVVEKTNSTYHYRRHHRWCRRDGLLRIFPSANKSLWNLLYQNLCQS